MSGGSDRAPTFGASELLGLMEHRLGGGAFGTVYSLRGHPSLAVKEIRLDALDDRLARNAEFELSALARLSHPGILRCHQVIVDDSFAYVVTDRYHDTLESVIISHMRAREPISRELLLSIVRQVTSALAYLHGVHGVDASGDLYQGVVHRDLKPANILVSEDGSKIALADFRLCRNAMTSGTTRAGSPAYMAPETLLEGKSTPASDIWALGVIVYELATLKKPNFLEGREPKDVFINGWKPDLSDVKNDFIRGILERIFVLDPAKRPTAKELAEMLQKPNVPIIELKAPTNVSDEGHKFLEAALNGVSARLELLESSLRAKTDEIGILKETLANKSAEIGALESTIVTQATEMDDFRKKLEMKSDQIDVLEGQCKEHLAMMKTLEDKIALLTANGPQSELLLLPRLMRAAHTNSAETVRILVESGDGIGKRDEQGRTALMHAAQQGHVEPARLLVEKEKGLQDRSGWTALMHAVHNNHPGVVEILAAHECGKTYSNGRTALMIAAERGYAEIVAALAPHEKGLTDSSGNTALMLAASNAHIEAVRQLAEYEKGARDIHSRTALMTAAQRGDLEMVKVLAEHEKGITDEDGRTALVHAARAGHRDIAELLMEHEKDVTGWTMLMCAAVLGDVDMVSQHINERGQKDKLGQTALILAAQNGRKEVVKLLIKHEGGVSGWTSLICAAYLGDINAVRDNLHEKGYKDVTGMTALMWVAERGYKEAVEVLIEHEKGIRDNQNHNTLYHALKTGHMETAKIVLPHEDPTDENGVTALMRAAARGDAEMVELLAPLQKGAKDKDGTTAFAHALKNRHTDIAMVLREHEVLSWTPLMSAAVTGDIETAKQHLSDKDKKNSDGDTAYALAAKAGQGAILELLDPTDEKGVTALMRAAERGDVEVVKLLIPLQKGKKADCFEIGDWFILHGGTALMMAAACGHAEVVELLVEHEAGVKDEARWTALMCAVRGNYPECVKLLLKEETGMQDNDDWTALMYAAFFRHGDCVKLLVDKEGGMQRSDGKTALMNAACNGHAEVVNLLVEKEGGMQDKNGWTALMLTALTNSIECISLLLEKEGGVQDTGGHTALMYAVLFSNKNTIKLLLENETSLQDNIFWIVLMILRKKNLGSIESLLESAKEIENRNSIAASILEIMDVTTEHIPLLLEREACMTSKDGLTALMMAAESNNPECIRLLLDKEAGMKTTYGQTALMWAARNGHLECVKLLIEKEAYAQDNGGWTALMHAVYNNKLESVKLLARKEKNMRTIREVRWEGDPKVYSPGSTALQIAKIKGYNEIVKILSQ
ncbi:Ankyrin repeat protein [Giardia duodenalis]|uniref:Ankyrin repeat protein n=1 Tax=Giardia intestinalis TaxID=5741 RepID=V6U2A2_GIAIN|nr:Ankyrin repeat protein [Giardia intestinalis]